MGAAIAVLSLGVISAICSGSIRASGKSKPQKPMPTAGADEGGAIRLPAGCIATVKWRMGNESDECPPIVGYCENEGKGVIDVTYVPKGECQAEHPGAVWGEHDTVRARSVALASAESVGEMAGLLSVEGMGEMLEQRVWQKCRSRNGTDWWVTDRQPAARDADVAMADPGSVAGSWMMVDVGALTGSTMHTLYKTPFLELMADAAGSDARIKARGVSAMMAQGDEMRQELRRVAAGVPGGRGMTQVQTSVGDFSKMDVTGMTWANNEAYWRSALAVKPGTYKLEKRGNGWGLACPF